MAKSKTPAQVWARVIRRVRRNVREYERLKKDAVEWENRLIFTGCAEGCQWVLDELLQASEADKPKRKRKARK